MAKNGLSSLAAVIQVCLHLPVAGAVRMAKHGHHHMHRRQIAEVHIDILEPPGLQPHLGASLAFMIEPISMLLLVGGNYGKPCADAAGQVAGAELKTVWALDLSSKLWRVWRIIRFFCM